MDRASVLCVLLLLCSQSRADLQDNEIHHTKVSPENTKVSPENTKVSPENTKVSPERESAQSQLRLTDFHALLQELSVKVGVLQFQVNQMQAFNKELSSKLSALQTEEVNPIKEHLQGQAAELNSIKTWASETENQVESLRRDREVGQVAFSASVLASGSGTTGPFNTDTPLVFRHVISNIGNAYNPNTGSFIAPVRGAYHFEFYIGAFGHSTRGTGALLMKNGQKMFGSWEHQTSGYGTSVNGATLLLEAGDVVFLLQWADTRIFDNEAHHSSFSGRLLFPM